MLPCLNNLVGIKGSCSDTAGPYQYYVNQLDGISIEAAEAAIDKEKESGFALLQEKIELAQDAMAIELSGFFADKIRLDSLIDEDIIGMYSDNMPAQAPEAYYKGVQLRMMGAANAEVFISSVRLFCQTTGAVTVKIIDLITGKTVNTFSIDAVAGEIVEKVINFKFPIFSKWLNLAVVYDASAIQSVQSHPYLGRANCNTCGIFANMFKCGGIGHYSYTRGIKLPLAGTLSQEKIIATPNTSGLSLTYSLVCSPEPLLCKLAPALAWPLLHKAGMFILDAMRFSKRLNSIVSLYKSEHKELSALYQMRYEASMDDIFKNIRMPDDICFRCEPKTKAVTAIP